MLLDPDAHKYPPQNIFDLLDLGEDGNKSFNWRLSQGKIFDSDILPSDEEMGKRADEAEGYSELEEALEYNRRIVKK
jgi:hypothetical protein